MLLPAAVPKGFARRFFNTCNSHPKLVAGTPKHALTLAWAKANIRRIKRQPKG
jgi:hypothetical protein